MDKKQKPWTYSDDEDLRTLHGHYSIVETAQILGRTIEGIRHRKKKLNLHRCLKMDAHNIVRRRKKQVKRAKLCEQ